jgi:hypothetical protein
MSSKADISAIKEEENDTSKEVQCFQGRYKRKTSMRTFTIETVGCSKVGPHYELFPSNATTEV